MNLNFLGEKQLYLSLLFFNNNKIALYLNSGNNDINYIICFRIYKLQYN